MEIREMPKYPTARTIIKRLRAPPEQRGEAKAGRFLRREKEVHE
jgi:hypothetical protein